jgi:hypothetical protein
MKLAWRIIAIIGLAAAVACCGCGRRAANPPARPAAQKATVPLPDWAPKNPSPEFMRAWKVLKPTPDDAFAQFAGGDPANLMLAKKASETWAAAYEFFGTLTDEQMRRFFSTKEIRIPIRSLTPAQRAALDNWFERWRVVMKGNGTLPEDWLVLLYKMGARQDLSNVEVGFTAKNEGRRVHTMLLVRQPDGHFEGMQNDFAYM